MKVQMALLASVIHEAKPGFASGDDLDEGIFQIRMNNITRDGGFDLTKKRRVQLDGKKANGLMVEVGDVMFNATNSPDLVGKSAFIGSLSEPTTFSNHFIRLRANPDKLDGSYLARWLHTQFQSGRFKGLCRQWVNQATVSKEALLGLEIPLLPVPEQRRVAAIFNHAEALRAKRREALVLIAQLRQALFIKNFGDPLQNSLGWPTGKVDDICDLVRGSSPRPQGDPRYFGGPIPRLMVADITRDGWCVTPKIDSLTEEGAKKSRPVKAGTVVMAVSGNVGLVSRLAVDACVHDGFVAFCNLNENICRPEYLLALLHYSKARHESSKAGAIFINITTSDIKQMSLPLPPIQKQNEFLLQLNKLEDIERGIRNSYNEFERLLSSLQSLFFRAASA